MKKRMKFNHLITSGNDKMRFSDTSESGPDGNGIKGKNPTSSAIFSDLKKIKANSKLINKGLFSGQIERVM